MAFTSKLGTADSTLLGDSMVMGIPLTGDVAAVDELVLTEEAVAGFIEGLSDAFGNTETAGTTQEMAVFSVDTLTLTDEAVNQAVEIEDTLALTEVLGLIWESNDAVVDTLALTEEAVPGLDSLLSAIDTLVLTDSADPPAEAFDTIVLTESAELADVTEDFFDPTDTAGVTLELGVEAIDTLILVESLVRGSLVMPVGSDDEMESFDEIYDQAAVEFIQIPTGLRDEAEGGGPTVGDAFDIIALTESTIGSWVLVTGGFSEAAVDTLTLTERADIAIPLAAEDTLTLTESAVGDAGPVAEDTLTLSESAVASVEQTTGLAAVDTLTLSESIGYSVDLVDLSCRYSPFVGTNTDPNAPPPPPTTYTAAGATPGFRLQFPETGAVTDEVIVRDPSFGNIDRLHFSRINHESRGGKLIIFADPIWPKTENQIFSFSGLKLAKVDEIQAFMLAHLGLEIRLIDFEDRLWIGIIKQVQDPKVQDNRERFTISFEFEGEKV